MPKRKNSSQKFMQSKFISLSAQEDSEMNNVLNMMEKLLHWAAIIESSDDAIISKSIDGYITSWNKGAQNLYGYTPEEIIGKPVSVLMPEGKKNDFPRIMNMLQKGQKVEHYETQRISKDGRIIDVSLTVSAIRDSNGNIIGASKIARDISARKEDERRREEFVSTTSHELKTPITSQKVFGELLENMIKKNGDKEYLPFIEKINDQTDKITNLIEDLVELSRVQTGRLKLVKRKFNFDLMVKDVIDEMRLVTNKEIILEGKTGKIFKGDSERLAQVINNLLSNAIKYSPKAKEVLVSLYSTDKNIFLSVRDYGIGIEIKDQEKIFEKFYRVTGPSEKTYPGMGIGLYLCREILNNHKGNIKVESEKGKGSTFIISLPLNITN